MTTGTMTISTSGYHDLDENHTGNIVITAPDVWLDLDGFYVLGSNGSTIGIDSRQNDTIVTNGYVMYHRDGVYIDGDDSSVTHVTVAYCQQIGIGVSGDNGVMHHNVVGNIDPVSTYTGVTVGIIGWGSNMNIYSNNVHNIKGNVESVGIAVQGSGSTSDNRVQGLGFTGTLELGLWHSGSGVTIDNSHYDELDYWIGAAGYVTVTDSTMESYYGDYGDGVIDGGGNTWNIYSLPLHFGPYW